MELQSRMHIVTVRVDDALGQAIDLTQDLSREMDQVYNVSSQFAVGNITGSQLRATENFQHQLQQGLQLSQTLTDEVERVQKLLLVPYTICGEYMTVPSNYMICPIFKQVTQQAINQIREDFHFSEISLLLHYTSVLASADIPDTATGIWMIVPGELDVRLSRFQQRIHTAANSQTNITSMQSDFYASMFQSLLTASLASFAVVLFSAYKLTSTYKRLLKTLRNQKENEQAHAKGDLSKKTAMASKVADYIGLQVSNFLVTYVWVSHPYLWCSYKVCM